MSKQPSERKTIEQVPDLYRLLGLQPLEEKRSKIEQALASIRDKAKAAKDSDSKLYERAVRLFTTAKENLLDETKKAAYDQAWQKNYGDQATTKQPEQVTASKREEPVVLSSTTAAKQSNATLASLSKSGLPTNGAQATMTWDMDELETLLPEDDPQRAFSMSEYLQHAAQLNDTSTAADFERLCSLLKGEPVAATSVTSTQTKTAAWADKSIYSTKAPTAPPTTPTHPTQRASGPALAKQLRRKRSQSMLLAIGGLLIGTAGVLGLVFFLVSKKESEKEAANQEVALAQPNQTNQSIAQQVQPNIEGLPLEPLPTKVGGGLPSVPGINGNPETNPLEGMVNQPMEPVAEPMPAPAMPAPAMPAPAMPDPAMPDPAMPDPAMPAPAMEPSMTDAKPEEAPVEPAPPPKPTLTADQKKAWRAAMSSVRKDLGKLEFDKATKSLETARELAVTSLQKQQLARLETASEMIREYNAFLTEAVSGLSAGETFMIGKQLEASFIEGSKDSISVRIRGKNETFTLIEMPNGLADALVDFKMPTQDPKSKARKAAFAAVHPKSNDLTLKKAVELMQEAAGAGATAEDMPQFLTEDYELP